MEYMSGGDLFDYFVGRGRLPLEEACRIFQQVVALPVDRYYHEYHALDFLSRFRY